ncbi:MAG: TRAP transporter substrate-binding protein [Candidatus Rokubacteria bacterium]|nr:TRAP transporter substrate-binding protein [Candidatus Rokubacteria bacterium]
MRKWVLGFTVMVVVLALLPTMWLAQPSAPVAIAQAPTFRMRIQTSMPSAATQFEGMQKFAERLQKMSAGRVKVDVLPIGAVVGLSEILEAVDKGVVEAGFAWTHVWSGKHPAAGLFGSPPAGAGTGMDQTTHLSWLISGEGANLLRELYRDGLKTSVVPFPIMAVGPEALGWFKRPIQSLDDFRKLRFRTPPGLPGEIYLEAGITAVSLPGPEILPAAQRGVIDAAEWGFPSDDLAFGFHRVWKNYYLQGLHQVTVVADLIVNGDFWKRLPPDVQAMIDTAAMAANLEHYALLIHRNGIALKELVEKHGVVLQETPREYFTQFPKATKKVLDKYAARDAFFKKVLESQRQFAQLAMPYRINAHKVDLFLAESALKDR